MFRIGFLLSSLSLCVLAVLPVPLRAQEGDTALGSAIQSLSSLDELQRILEEAEEPLTTEQVAALEPLLEPGTQRGVLLDPVVGERASEVLTDAQRNAVLWAEASRTLMEEGLPGLRQQLATANVPSLTFDQETQIRSTYDAHMRALDDLLEANGGDRAAIASEIRELQDQLFLASLKFLNPVQRTAFAGSMSAVDLAALNSDLPEDPNELQEYLNDLRSPAGGNFGNNNSGNFNGGNFSGGNRGGGNRNGGGRGGGGGNFNGFSSGGTLNRDEIAEIRMNENSFTAEQSNPGRSQTIIRRGGAGTYTGNLTFNFYDESLDARNAFADARPPYQRRNFSGNLSGPIIRDRVTLRFEGMHNEAEDGDNLQALTPTGLRSDAISRPAHQRRYNISSTAQLTENNVLNVSFNRFRRKNERNDVGQEGLPEQGSTNQQEVREFNVGETSVLSLRWANEVNFQGRAGSQDNIPDTPNTPQVYVQGTLRTGGSTSDSHTQFRNYNFDDLLMYTGNAWNIRTGYAGSYSRNDSESRTNFNGTFTFSTLYDYCGAVDPNFLQVGCQAERDRVLALDPTAVPEPATKYEVNQGDPILNTSQFQSATFLQTDWRARPELTLSFGVRYEWQTNLEDHNNIDPRFGWAYALGADTVLRGGTGIFHDRLDQNEIRNLMRFDGTRQQSLVISNPSWPDPFATSGGGTVSVPSDRRVWVGDLAAPYSWHNEVTIETTLDSGVVLTGSYGYVRGIRLYRERNINAPLPQCMATMPNSLLTSGDKDAQYEFARLCRPFPDEGNITQLESTGTSTDNRIRLGFRHRMSFLNVNGSYEFSSNYDDVSTPVSSYNQDAEWGPSGARHRVDASVNVRLPFNVNADTGFNWRSGSPYTLRTGSDNNFDTETNDRPIDPLTGIMVPRNSLLGPGSFVVDLQFSKSVQLRSDRVEVEGGPIAGGGYYGQRTGVRMTIQANISNLLNKVNFQNPSGVQSSPFFGQYTRADDARKVSMQVRFDF